MNLKDLSQINIEDLKNIDIKGIKDNLQTNPQILINIVLVALTVFVSTYFYTNHNKQLKVFVSQINTLKEKVQAADTFKKTEENYNEFIQTLPESLNVDQLNEKISSLAFKNNIKIITFSPAGSNSSEFYSIDSIEVALEAPSYESIVTFIEDIETANYSIRVDSWSGKLQNQAGQSNSRRGFQRRSSTTETVDTSSDQSINLNLKISTIEFKNK